MGHGRISCTDIHGIQSGHLQTGNSGSVVNRRLGQAVMELRVEQSQYLKSGLC